MFKEVVVDKWSVQSRNISGGTKKNLESSAYRYAGSQLRMEPETSGIQVSVRPRSGPTCSVCHPVDSV